MTLAEVKLWGTRIGAVKWVTGRNDIGHSVFEYDKDFIHSGMQVSPIMMRLGDKKYTFPQLNNKAFKGLPGLLADSLPDKFGNALIDAWLVRQGREPASFNPVERLCYTGTRGMGALEYSPATRVGAGKAETLNVAALVNLASEILTKRNQVDEVLLEDEEDALNHIIKVGTSAGGARAKAVIAFNPETKEVRSGETQVGEGFEHWLLKFDGVDNNRDKELADPKGFGRIEYAYYLMATAAGIDMMKCDLLEENGRAHFMTRRFDRPGGSDKLHIQSLGAMAHYDFNLAGAYSYEQALLVMRRLNLPVEQRQQQVLRAMFNVMARNQDDHVKNIAYIMDRTGQWRLSPAFDVAYAYNPKGEWTHQHQMSINGKQTDFTLDDFVELAKIGMVKEGFVQEAYDAIREELRRWPHYAETAGVSDKWTTDIEGQMITDLPTEN